jgi:hypothetical protein
MTSLSVDESVARVPTARRVMLEHMKRALFAIALLGCGSSPKPKTLESTDSEPKFAEAIHAAAITYQTWGRVDDEPRVAPALCAPAATNSEKHVRTSTADGGPHERKLYYLWATNRQAYRAKAVMDVGFTIVKEAFREAGVGREIGPAAGLFVMKKVGGDSTDAGWIYGTVAVDGTVTSAGRVATCMGCHDDAPPDRLFGLK